MATTRTVDEYLAGIPEGPRAALEVLRATIRDAAPDAAESISYGMPTWKHRGRAIASLGAFARHCSLFPYSRGVMERYAAELEPYDTTGRGPNIRFTLGTPLPAGLVARIVATRIGEIDAGEG